MIPNSAIVWAQVIESNTVRAWNRIVDIKDPKNDQVLIKPPSETKICAGSSAVHDIQLSQLTHDAFTPLLAPQKIFTFDWSGHDPIIFNEMKTCRAPAIATGTAQAVFMWWELAMDEDKEIILSCAPAWEHPDIKEHINKDSSFIEMADKIPWRDHWMQAIYYLIEEIPLTLGEPTDLIGCHDEYSFWFQLTNQPVTEFTKRPICNCSLHLSYSRSRIGQLNDKTRNDKYINTLRKHINSDTVCISFSDGSLLGLAAANLGAKKIIVFEPNYLSRRSLENFVAVNNLSDKVEIVSSFKQLENYDNNELNLVIGEPYYVNSILPWDNLRFWYLATNYAPNIPTIPVAARIRGVAVEFKDLHKIRTPLVQCQGFNHAAFDKLTLVKNSSIFLLSSAYIKKTGQ